MWETNSQAMPWLRWLAAGLSLQRPSFVLASTHVEFLVDKVALGQVFLRVLQFSPAHIIPLGPILIYLGDEHRTIGDQSSVLPNQHDKLFSNIS
jgi:hypothetical protein